MATTKISDKYQVVIPKSVRKQLALKQGQALHVYALREGVLLSPVKRWPDEYLGSQADLRGKINWADALAEERASWDHR